jgi:iron complex outermembrane recepter protein
MKWSFMFAASVAVAALAAPALAQGPHHKGTPGADPYHDVPKPEIVVTAPFERNRTDLLSGTSVLSGVALTRDMKPTIGDTLAHQPGVSATSFGPNASRPVLRGFQGERVRVLTDGIGSFDVSNTSVDHAVVIDPLTAERIEVLRGPSALLFGSGAIGGVVNVVGKRIPRRIPDEDFHLEATGTYGSAANERSGAGALDVPVADKIVFHLDGTYSKTDDLDTGGYILAPALLEEAKALDLERAAMKGKLPNSAARTWDVAGGASVITDTGNLGFSVSHYDNVYGVPIRYTLDPADPGEQVHIAMKQNRADFRAEVDTGGGFIDKIRTRWGWADYRHSEIAEDGTVNTTFFAQGLEGRVELAQANRGGWKGAVGGQLVLRDLHIVGEEKFLPKNETQQYGLFTLQEFDLGLVKAEIGGRYEHSVITARADPLFGDSARRRFDAFSGSAGASIGVAEGWRVGLNLSRTERAPSAEELFANGPHGGTAAFEQGDRAFGKEKNWSVEATLHGSGPAYMFEASAYHSWFSGYIYEAQQPQAVCQARTPFTVDLPCFTFQQANARYYGFEVQGSLRLAMLGDWAIVTDGLADYVHAQISSVGPAPRIPPLRLLGGIEAQSDRVQGRIEVERVEDQHRVSDLETPTDGYTMVNASVSVKPFGKASGTNLILAANNIFDVEARRHASFLKDYAPLPGRDIRVTARFSF